MYFEALFLKCLSQTVSSWVLHFFIHFDNLFLLMEFLVYRDSFSFSLQLCSFASLRLYLEVAQGTTKHTLKFYL